MAALHEEGAGQGPPKRPHVPGLIDAGLVPLQTLMHQCWHQVTICFAHFQCTTPSSAHFKLCGQSTYRTPYREQLRTVCTEPTGRHFVMNERAYSREA